jgi:protein TonB
MAYADNKMSSGRMTAIVIVALIHALLGYAFVTGLAYNVIKKAAEDLKTFNVEEPPPPPDEPPPPPPPPAKVEPAKARANLASYVSDADYPPSAIRAEEQGTTGFRLEVGADGRVSACTVTSSSGSSALDAATCRIMKSRARFTPARDNTGAATRDSVSSRIRWVLPQE